MIDLCEIDSVFPGTLDAPLPDPYHRCICGRILEAAPLLPPGSGHVADSCRCRKPGPQ